MTDTDVVSMLKVRHEWRAVAWEAAEGVPLAYVCPACGADEQDVISGRKSEWCPAPILKPCARLPDRSEL